MNASPSNPRHTVTASAAHRQLPSTVRMEWGLDGAPSLLAEIAWSPTDYRDRGIKREIYALYAVPEYWLIDPEHHCITVCSDPHGDTYRSQIATNDVAVSATIPGLSVDLGDLFAPIPGI